MLANMDQKLSIARNRKLKAHPVIQPYAGIDLPPSDDEEDYFFEKDEIFKKSSRKEMANNKILEICRISDKELRKQKKKDTIIAQALEQEAMKQDDRDAFTVLIGSHRADYGRDNCHISHGKRYGLKGPNGKGKSTLLKLLAWRKIPVPKNIDILLVEQEIVGDDTTALDAVVSANAELVNLRLEVKSLLLEGENGNDNGEKLTELYEKLHIMGADAAEAEASKILSGLGFTKGMQGRPTRSFCGGLRMRISLARALFVKPSLLLLDEPTNHLDLRGVVWLKDYLSKWKKTLIVVSHDTNFLNIVCNGVIHLHDFKLETYRGSYDDFVSGYEQRRKEMNKKYEAYEKQLKAAKRAVNHKQQTENVKDKAKIAAKKNSKGKVDEGEETFEAPHKWRDYSAKFRFPECTEIAPPLLQLINVSFRYPEKEDFKLSGVDVGIDMGTRVAIMGPNGAGKSTLLKLITGELNPTDGESRKSQKLRIGRYSQHFEDTLTFSETPVQYLLRHYPDQEGCSKQEAVRTMLGQFGLPSHNHLSPIDTLSGGQKARVLLASIAMSRPHIMILDEPTNHLDMESIDALADALVEFSGGVVVVSHNSRLVSRICEDQEKSQIWEVDNGSVGRFDGTYEEYEEKLMKEIRVEMDELYALY
ncbi:ABC transporter F family member 4 [Tanacetum coccineum]|uniref:ABC transporter F family member 4 n=1 Tax=Tanacetum coccineum TaxID=301880 RepID=A0ABQ5FF68_9ASTR